MVRINLLNPNCLSDQHLIAEYNEILMLLGYVRKNPCSSLDKIPEKYKLGRGHILFFKNKLDYIKKRFNTLSREMKIRGFNARKIADIRGFRRDLKNNWHPKERDLKIIRERLIDKIKLKPRFYRYCGERKPTKFFINKIKNAK